MTKTFVVKDAEGRDGGGREMPRGGKVNSTCCRVHKNAELVPDNAGIRMYVRTTILCQAGTSPKSHCPPARDDDDERHHHQHVRVDSEISVMYQPDRGVSGGMQGRCMCCLCEKAQTRVLRVGLWRAS